MAHYYDIEVEAKDPKFLLLCIAALKRAAWIGKQIWRADPDYECKTCKWNMTKGNEENKSCSAPHPCAVCKFYPHVAGGVFCGCMCGLECDHCKKDPGILMSYRMGSGFQHYCSEACRDQAK